MDEPISQEKQEAELEKKRFISAVEEGLHDIDEGNVHSLDKVKAELRAKFDF